MRVFCCSTNSVHRMTRRFRILYILVVMEVGSRRMFHCNLTDHPRAESTIQQLREAIPSDHSSRFLIHDRHSTFSAGLDEAVRNLGIEALRTPVRTPQVRVFPTGLLRRPKDNNDIYYEPMSELSQHRSWPDFITNTISNEWLHSVYRVCAEHSHLKCPHPSTADVRRINGKGFESMRALQNVGQLLARSPFPGSRPRACYA